MSYILIIAFSCKKSILTRVHLCHYVYLYCTTLSLHIHLQSAAALEQEVINLRHLYEAELKKLRAEIGKVSTSVVKHKRQNELLLAASEDLKQRYENICCMHWPVSLYAYLC